MKYSEEEVKIAATAQHLIGLDTYVMPKERAELTQP